MCVALSNVTEMVFAGLGVVGGGDQLQMPEPPGDLVVRAALHPVFREAAAAGELIELDE